MKGGVPDPFWGLLWRIVGTKKKDRESFCGNKVQVAECVLGWLWKDVPGEENMAYGEAETMKILDKYCCELMLSGFMPTKKMELTWEECMKVVQKLCQHSGEYRFRKKKGYFLMKKLGKKLNF